MEIYTCVVDEPTTLGIGTDKLQWVDGILSQPFNIITMHTYLMIPTFDFVFENEFVFLNYCNYVLECAFMAPIQI